MDVEPPAKPCFLDLSDEAFAEKLNAVSVWKKRSEDTLLEVHLPELKARLGLNVVAPDYSPLSDQISDAHKNPFAPRPDLLNTSRIEVVYIGNSMLERFRSTGRSTNIGHLAKEGTAWNAGCGGDKNEHVIYRLESHGNSMLHTLKTHCDIKLWLLVSGTNNLRPKKPFRASDVESYRSLLEACLRIAPKSKLIACDMFYRKDIPDAIVDESNDMLRSVVQDVNQEFLGRKQDTEQDVSRLSEYPRIQWVDARALIEKKLLIDHVHLTEEGYAKWDEVLWPYVRDCMESFKATEQEKSH